ncbi:MAG TPA: Gfo/Idh/MocA family oxidoreductase [Pseudolysinimonas sp.]|nr:Gfo/Idh/MocA family oxidoreductase [Pseudolysinimonas sp.]
MTPVRWGILGAAGINAAMAPAIVAAGNAELVAIASRTAARADEAAARYGARRAIEGYDALLADPEIEAVYIPLPNAFHHEWVLRAIAAGKHVLCEKPMTITGADAREMADAASAAGLLLAEAFMYAHHPRYARIRELIATGEIGTVRTILTTFSFDASGELDHSGFQGLPGSGAVYDVGCYAVHSARALLGAEPTAVTATASVSALHGDIDMATSALVEFGTATLLFHVDMAATDTDVIEIIGTAGRIVVPHAFICAPEDGDFLVETARGSRTETADVVDHYRLQTERFSAAVRGGAELLFPPADAVRNAAVLDAVTRSWQQKVRVPL